MKIKLNSVWLIFIAILSTHTLTLQAQVNKLKIEIVPDRANWVYQMGDSVNFTVNVTKNNQPVNDVVIKYTLGYEKMEPFETKELTLANGSTLLKSKGMDEPGFLACRVFIRNDSTSINEITQVAFAPEKLTPKTEMPADFVEFWENAKKINERVPMNPVVTHSAEFSTDEMDCYHIRLDNFRPGTHVYGYLSIPKGGGKYPAVLYVPGAGVSKVRPNRDLVSHGVISLQIGIHGIPFTLPDEAYTELKDGALRGYQYFSLDDKDEYYYKRVILGCLRAIDYLFTLPEFDGSTLAVSGGSQGGGLSIITTALDPRVQHYVSFYPAMCDHIGYLHNRAGGWPHHFAEHNKHYRTAARIENSKYYDAANFARLINVPGFYSWGYNDLSCPLTSMYSAYNIVNAPKELLLELPNGHVRSKRQQQAGNNWLLEKLGVKL